MGFGISTDIDEIPVKVAISQIYNRLIALDSGLHNILRTYGWSLTTLCMSFDTGKIYVWIFMDIYSRVWPLAQIRICFHSIS